MKTNLSIMQHKSIRNFKNVYHVKQMLEEGPENENLGYRAKGKQVIFSALPCHILCQIY